MRINELFESELKVSSLEQFAKIAVAQHPKQIKFMNHIWQLAADTSGHIDYFWNESVISIHMDGSTPASIEHQDAEGMMKQVVLNPKAYVHRFFSMYPWFKKKGFDKDEMIKALLIAYKGGEEEEDNSNAVIMKNIIDSMIKIGYDWPELKTLSRSIG